MEIYISEHNIEPYIPHDLAKVEKIKIAGLAWDIMSAIDDKQIIGFEQSGTSRLILPHAIHLQESTPHTQVMLPSHINTRMKLYKHGAQKAIGVEGYQVLSKETNLEGSTRKEPSRNGWKTFLLHNISNYRLFTLEEIREIFQLKHDGITSSAHLSGGFTTIADFVRNWNHSFRTFLAQAPSTLDALVRRSE